MMTKPSPKLASTSTENMIGLNAIVEKLRSGAWVLNELKPLFLQSLLDSLKQRLDLDFSSGSIPPLHILTALRYGLISETVYSKDARIPQSAIAQAFKTDLVVLSRNELEKTWFKDDLNELKKLSPAIARLYSSTIQLLVHVNLAGFAAASSPKLFGLTILTDDYIRSNQKLKLLSMVHELAHQELFLINLIDRLIVSEKDKNMIYAPFQRKLRPPIGRLHAAHVLFRMIQFCEETYQATDELSQSLQATLLTFDGNQELTPMAQILVNEIYARN